MRQRSKLTLLYENWNAVNLKSSITVMMTDIEVHLNYPKPPPLFTDQKLYCTRVKMGKFMKHGQMIRVPQLYIAGHPSCIFT